MQPLIEHSTTAAGFRTRMLELEGDGPGLVLLHGWGDSADKWRPLLALLAEHEPRAIAFDLPGYRHADRVVEGAVLPQLDAFARLSGAAALAARSARTATLIRCDGRSSPSAWPSS